MSRPHNPKARTSNLRVVPEAYERAVLQGFFLCWPPRCPVCHADMVLRMEELTHYCWLCDYNRRPKE